MTVSAPHVAEYLDSTAAVDAFIDSISTEPLIGFDTEGASFYRFVDRIYLMQLSTRTRTALIDPLAVENLDRLGAFMGDPRVEVVLHDAEQDLRFLHKDYGFHVGRLFDTRIAARLLGITTLGLAGLLDRYFGIHLDKEQQRADWSRRPLGPALIEYAAQDTFHLPALRDVLTDELERAGRLEWAREEFVIAATAHWEPVDRGPAHYRIKGARELGPRQLAVLAELSAWRRRLAEAQNRALFRIAADDLLAAIAKAAPGLEAGALRRQIPSLPGFPRNLHGRSLDAIFEAVARGMAVPESALSRFPAPPRPVRDPALEKLMVALKQARDPVAAALGIEPTVLATREQMEDVARARPATPDELLAIPSLRRWQAQQLAAAFTGPFSSSP